MTAAHADRLQSRRNRDLIKAQQAERGIDEDGPHNGDKASACLKEGKPNILGCTIRIHSPAWFTLALHGGQSGPPPILPNAVSTGQSH